MPDCSIILQREIYDLEIAVLIQRREQEKQSTTSPRASKT